MFSELWGEVEALRVWRLLVCFGRVVWDGGAWLVEGSDGSNGGGVCWGSNVEWRVESRDKRCCSNHDISSSFFPSVKNTMRFQFLYLPVSLSDKGIVFRTVHPFMYTTTPIFTQHSSGCLLLLLRD